MTTAVANRPPLLQFALDGARVRQAATVLEREVPRLVSALRRAVPFLSRRRVPIELSRVHAVPVADLLEGLARPVHVTRFFADPGHAAGELLLDAPASALLIDGILGGDGHSLPELNPAGLSAPQDALVAGLAHNILRSLSSALTASLGVSLEPRVVASADNHVESAPIACVLEIGDGDRVGRIALLLPREPLLSSLGVADQPLVDVGDPRIPAVLDDVELLLVVELGRVPYRLGQLAELRVGDTLRLDVPVTSLVSVRADGHELMRGRPTNSGGRIGVRIVATAAANGHTRHDS